MIIGELYNLFFSSLKDLYNEKQIFNLFKVYLKYKLLYCNDLINYSDEIDVAYDIYIDIDLLSKNYPIQYLIKKIYFFNNFFYINSNTLIPRPETEELVYMIIDNFKNRNIKVLDLCTGSGVIAISINKFLHSEVVAIDISKKALNVAKFNSYLLDCNIDYINADIFDDIYFNSKFDLIVSNPPYVIKKDIISKNIIYEPYISLYVEGDNLKFYKRIIDIAKNSLEYNGTIYCEINQFLYKDIYSLFKKEFKHVQIIKDISGNYRFIKCNNGTLK